MSQPELVKKVADVLRTAGIDYMLTGSLVSSFQGEPRSTHDADFVVRLSLKDAGQLLQAFPDDRYYLSEDAIRSAVQAKRMFNLIDNTEGDKADFWILTEDAYDQVRFSRRIAVKVFGAEILVSRPEDTILYKLLWAKKSGSSERQLGDALGIYSIQRDVLDQDYLDSWAVKLNVLDLLRQIRSRASSDEAPKE